MITSHFSNHHALKLKVMCHLCVPMVHMIMGEKTKYNTAVNQPADMKQISPMV